MPIVTKALPLQPPAATASFFERMKFIIEDQGLQSYVQRKGFNERSVSWSMRMFFSMSLWAFSVFRGFALLLINLAFAH